MKLLRHGVESALRILDLLRPVHAHFPQVRPETWVDYEALLNSALVFKNIRPALYKWLYASVHQKDPFFLYPVQSNLRALVRAALQNDRATVLEAGVRLLYCATVDNPRPGRARGGDRS